MIIILSQKIDSMSSYEGDEVFIRYHYPKRYRNQIHTGDTFVYYQGNRYSKDQRYYFGTGTIGKIVIENEENYYAELVDVIKFNQKVSIYLPDNGYVESIGFDTVRNSSIPPWQSSIRPLSLEAYDYIIQNSGCNYLLERYDIELKDAIRKYYIEHDDSSLLEMERLIHMIASIKNIKS